MSELVISDVRPWRGPPTELLIRAGALLDRYIVESAWRTGTDGGAAVLGLTDYGLTPDAEANLFVIQGATPTEALMDRPTDRLVIARGRVVAGGEGVR